MFKKTPDKLIVFIIYFIVTIILFASIGIYLIILPMALNYIFGFSKLYTGLVLLIIGIGVTMLLSALGGD